MKKAIIETATGRKVNIVTLPDNWTGKKGEWQAPDGFYLSDDATTFRPNQPPPRDLDAEATALLADAKSQGLIDVTWGIEKRIAILELRTEPKRDDTAAKVHAAVKARLP
ncbi:MAG: hypothetical protein U1A72_16865 [Sulfuritalea sp.]|nr:hypothetical protein [Sulfuritalea sp.]